MYTLFGYMCGSDRARFRSPHSGCISASASCLRACFFCHGTFEYACYSMSDYWVSGKEKEMSVDEIHHAF